MDEIICGICREEKPIMDFITRCGHNFHEDCLKDWLRDQRKCPYCFQKISTSKEIEQFYFRGGEIENFDSDSLITLLKYICDTGHKSFFVKLIRKLYKIKWNFNDSKLKDCYLLHEACRRNKLKIIKLLLKSGVDVNALGKFESTPFQIACEQRNFKIMSLLIRYGADINVDKSKSPLPLYAACKRGDIKVSRFLIDHGADVNAVHCRISKSDYSESCFFFKTSDENPYDATWFQDTPLNAACEIKNFEIICLLAKNGANLDAQGVYQNTSLQYACRHGEMELASLLVGLGADVNAVGWNGTTALHSSCFESNEDISQFLIGSGANVNARDIDQKTPLHEACRVSKSNLARLFVNSGGDVNAVTSSGHTPLHIAAESNNLEIARFLIDRGVDINAATSSGSTSLHIACTTNHLRIARLLIKSGANIHAFDKKYNTPLHCAIESNKSVIVRLLVDSGANVNVHDQFKRTPLQVALFRRHSGIIRLLVQSGADVNAVGSENLVTPLHDACRYGDLGTVKFLLESGANVNATLCDGSTPLHFSIHNGSRSLQIIRSLVEFGSKVNNSPDAEVPSPLHKACKQGNLEIVQFLVESGADVHAIASDGCTPLQYAESSGSYLVVHFLSQNIPR